MQWAVPVEREEDMVAPAMEAVVNNKDLLKSIFEQLDLHEICIAATTCQLWNQVANHDDFWKQIDFRGKQVLPIDAAALLQRHPRVEQLDLSALQGPHQGGADGALGFVQQIAPHLTSLQRLAFTSAVKPPSLPPPGCIPDQLVQYVSLFAALTCLSLTGARLSPSFADLAHPTLRCLILDQTDASILHIKCPELTCLSMADSPGKRMPNLDESPALLALDLSRCFKLQELSTRTTIMRLTALQELNMGGLANILDQTLQALSASLGQLTKLEMPKAAGVTFQGVLSGFPALRRLDLSRCDQLNSAALPAALESFECLESVSLDNCTLTTLKLSMSQLKDLSVCGCQGLTELDVRAWQLSRLDLGPTSCPRSSNRNLSKLTVTSGALKRMEWVELHKLSYVELDCPALTELWVWDCNFSDAAVLQRLGDTAVPPPLASDVLSWARPGAALQLAPLASGSSSDAGAASTQLAGSQGGAGAAVAAGQAPAGGAWGVPVVDAFDVGLDGLLGDDEGQQPRGEDGEDDGDGGDSDQGGGGHGGGGSRGRAPLRRLLSGEAAPSTYEADAACVERRYGSWLGRDRRRGAPDKAGMYFVMPGEPAAGAGNAGASSSAAAAAAAGGAGPSGRAGADPINTALGGSAGAASSEAAAAATGGSQRNQDVSAGVLDALCTGADAAGGPSNGQHASPQQEQPAQMRQQQQQQQRPRHRRGGAGGTRARQQQARWRMALDCWLGSQSPSSGGAAADTDEDRWLEQEDVPMCVVAAAAGAAPSTQEGGPPGSQQQQASQSAGPRQFQLHPPASCRPALHRQAAAGGGGGGGDGDSSDADSDIDASRPVAAGGSMGAALMSRQQQRYSSSNRVAAGKGGVPRLRVLHVEGCDRLKELQLSHAVLQQVSVSGCNSLVVVALHAPKLSSLELQELGELKGACLQEVAVSSLTMGSCSTLQGMELSSTQLMLLDVRGCGGLQQLHLDCPALQVLDATFCGSLADEGLAAAVANIPPLRQLALSVCCQISSTGLSALSKLTGLQELDLSYTEVSSLQPILDGCPRLRSLSIASCRGLGEDALLPLLDAQQPPLSQLTSLDASYCDVQDVLAAQLLLRCRQLKHLALSGCAGVTDEIWQQVEAGQLQRVRGTVAVAPAAEAAALMDLDDGADDGCEGSGGAELGAVDALAAPVGGGSGSSLAADGSSSSDGISQLESLSLVRCNNLRSLCLGLLPAEGKVELLPPKHYLLSASRSVLRQAAPQGGWVEVPSAVSQLTSLKAGLSGVQVVALALPKLAHLDLSSCKHLRVLELRCPLLLQLQLQACTALPVVSAVRGVLGAPHLQMLDVQHMLGAAGGGGGPADQDGAEALDEAVAHHGSLKPGSILRCTSVCKVCHKLAEHCSLG